MDEIRFLTWNTQLYEMGNKVSKDIKKIDEDLFFKIIKEIKKFFSTSNKAIAVLQEIPYKCNNNGYKEHELFTKFKNEFPESNYSMLYNISTENQIMMTVVLSPKVTGKIIKLDGINNNRCVLFGIENQELSIMGVHSGCAEQVLTWKKNKNPDIILGDFNAGDYEKRNATDVFITNRTIYRDLIREYTDILKGQNTRKYVFGDGKVYETPIDHVLIKKDKERMEKYLFDDISINTNTNNLSDHYLISFKLSLNKKTYHNTAVSK